jgi:bacteriocin-like protein
VTESVKAGETPRSAKPAEQKKSASELNEKDLDQVSGGKPSSGSLMKSCATGQHIKEGVLTS